MTLIIPVPRRHAFLRARCANNQLIVFLDDIRLHVPLRRDGGFVGLDARVFDFGVGLGIVR